MKSDNAYKTIGEVAKILGLTDNKKGTLSTHTIRFWEKEFKQIKPKILNGNRRYFDNETIDLLKKIKFLLKDQSSGQIDCFENKILYCQQKDLDN